MNLEAWQSSEEKHKWRVVRLDNYTDVPGEIISGARRMLQLLMLPLDNRRQTICFKTVGSVVAQAMNEEEETGRQEGRGSTDGGSPDPTALHEAPLLREEMYRAAAVAGCSARLAR
jgi:hypothetical protein